MRDYSIQIKQSINGDEYYTPENAVNMILPYIQKGGGKYKTIWCPFDKEYSAFVQVLTGGGA